jgi:DNA-binding LytR/AlgR family response regulator
MITLTDVRPNTDSSHDYAKSGSMSEHVTDTFEIGHRRVTGDHVGQVKAPPAILGRCHTPLARIAIRVKGGTRFVSTDCVLVVRAQGNYVLLQCESGSYLLRESITTMQRQLEPYGFVRIHRSVLVNRSWVEEIRPCLTGDYGLRMRGGKEFKVTRTYKYNLKSLAELWLSNDSFVDK